MPAPDVSTEIRILSAFLGHKHINWRPDEIDHVKNPSSDSITKDGNLSAKPYFHLANLLNIQKDIVTAVTGTIDRPDTAAVIVYSTNSRSSTAKSKSEGAFRSGRTIKAKFLSMDALEKEILCLPCKFSKSYQGLGLDQYVQDLFSLFAAAKDKRASVQHILKWVIYQCWSKLHKRLGRVKQFQRGNLFKALAEWTLLDEDRSNETDMMANTGRTEIIISRWLISACTRHKLTLHNIDTNNPTLVFNLDTAEELIHGIASAFNEIAAVDNWVYDKINKGTQRPWEPLAKDSNDSSENISSPSTDKSRLDRVVSDFLLLSTILENKRVQAFFSKSSLRYKLKPIQLPRLQTDIPAAAISDTHSGKVDSTTHDTKGDTHAPEGDIHVTEEKSDSQYDATEADDDLGLLMQSDYTGGFALRYMRMVVSTATALQYICQRADILSRLAVAEATLITLSEKPRSRNSMRTTVYDSIVEDIKQHVQNEGSPQTVATAAIKWFRTAWNEDHVASESACHIHAEAGLMALACEANSSPVQNVSHGSDSKYMVAFEGITDLRIGINMKCCSLCFRLGQLLNSDSGVDITFQLPDTHEVIFAWDPPSFGIPERVLQRLRNDLREELIHIAVEKGNQAVNMTRQSSPTSGSEYNGSPDGRGQTDFLSEQAKIQLRKWLP